MHRMFGFRCFKKNSRNVQLMSKRVAATLVCLRTCEEGIDIFFYTQHHTRVVYQNFKRSSYLYIIYNILYCTINPKKKKILLIVILKKTI